MFTAGKRTFWVVQGLQCRVAEHLHIVAGGFLSCQCGLNPQLFLNQTSCFRAQRAPSVAACGSCMLDPRSGMRSSINVCVQTAGCALPSEVKFPCQPEGPKCISASTGASTTPPQQIGIGLQRASNRLMISRTISRAITMMDIRGWDSSSTRAHVLCFVEPGQ